MMKKLTRFLLAMLVCAVLLPATALADTCYHKTGLEAGTNKCANCGAEIVAEVTKNGSVEYFDNFEIALENGGGTVKLLANVYVTSYELKTPIGTSTLDLNGHRIDRPESSGAATLTVPDGSSITLTGSGTVTVPIEVRGGGALTVDNSKLTIGEVDAAGGSLTVNAERTLSLIR